MSHRADVGVPELSGWDRLNWAECDAIARELARSLPHPWAYVATRSHSMGDQARYVAFFDHAGSEFALIPGGRAVLGYDPASPPVLSEEWSHEYFELVCCEPVDLRAELLEYLAAGWMTPLRCVILKPLLMETTPPNFDGRSATPIEVAPLAGKVTIYREDRGREWTYREVIAELCRDGFQITTTDEWEYACGAGSRTFWRWGDEFPPIDNREWAESSLPNAFGLNIAQNSYDCEWCREPDVWRGGDGGSSCCGGENQTIIWTTLATAYSSPPLREIEGENFLDTKMIGPCRRTFPLTRD